MLSSEKMILSYYSAGRAGPTGSTAAAAMAHGAMQTTQAQRCRAQRLQHHAEPFGIFFNGRRSESAVRLVDEKRQKRKEGDGRMRALVAACTPRFWIRWTERDRREKANAGTPSWVGLWLFSIRLLLCTSVGDAEERGTTEKNRTAWKKIDRKRSRGGISD